MFLWATDCGIIRFQVTLAGHSLNPGTLFQGTPGTLEDICGALWKTLVRGTWDTCSGRRFWERLLGQTLKGTCATLLEDMEDTDTLLNLV